MHEGVLTIRTRAREFKSVLFDDGDNLASGSPWHLDIRDLSPHPCVFVGRQDVDATQETKILNRRAPDGHAGATVVSHSADRLARAIVLAMNAPSDPRTLTAWGQSVGVSRGALRVWCATAGVPARSCLDFLRILRAVILSENHGWDLLGMLDVVDQRSLIQLLERGGIRQLCELGRPTVDEFMRAQRFLGNRQVLGAVDRRLKSNPG